MQIYRGKIKINLKLRVFCFVLAKIRGFIVFVLEESVKNFFFISFNLFSHLFFANKKKEEPSQSGIYSCNFNLKCVATGFI